MEENKDYVTLFDDDGFINIVWDGLYNENEYIY